MNYLTTHCTVPHYVQRTSSHTAQHLTTYIPHLITYCTAPRLYVLHLIMYCTASHYVLHVTSPRFRPRDHIFSPLVSSLTSFLFSGPNKEMHPKSRTCAYKRIHYVPAVPANWHNRGLQHPVYHHQQLRQKMAGSRGVLLRMTPRWLPSPTIVSFLHPLVDFHSSARNLSVINNMKKVVKTTLAAWASIVI